MFGAEYRTECGASMYIILVPIIAAGLSILLGGIYYLWPRASASQAILHNGRPIEKYDTQFRDIRQQLSTVAIDVDKLIQQFNGSFKANLEELRRREVDLSNLELDKQRLVRSNKRMEAHPATYIENTFARSEHRSARRDYKLFIWGVIVTVGIELAFKFLIG
jgi:hypothetical protein